MRCVCSAKQENKQSCLFSNRSTLQIRRSPPNPHVAGVTLRSLSVRGLHPPTPCNSQLYALAGMLNKVTFVHGKRRQARKNGDRFVHETFSQKIENGYLAIQIFVSLQNNVTYTNFCKVTQTYVEIQYTQ